MKHARILPRPRRPKSLLPLLLVAASLQAGATARGAEAAENPGQAFHALLDAEWDHRMREEPEWASSLGDRRGNDRWSDMSLAAIERRHADDERFLRDLRGIDRSALTPADRLNYDLFAKELGERIEGYPFHAFLMPLSHAQGVHTAAQLHQNLRFETLKDFEDWIDRIRAFGTLVDQHIALMSQGLAEKRVPPRVILDRVGPQIDEQIVTDATRSVFYQPFQNMPAAIGEADRARLRAEASKAILEVVVPALERFRSFFHERYLPAGRTSVGVWDLPDGEAYYAFQARSHTTTDLTPAEIHEIGLREVARIRAEMDRIIRQVDFEGSFDDFLAFMRSDPRFYVKTPEELFKAYQVTCKRIDPELVRLFKTLPRMPYGVRPVPEQTAPYTTTAYYDGPAADGSRAGYFYVNLYKPEMRPTYEIEVLTAHEAVPGHHLQIALAMELGELPEFRRYGGHTAFIEGWGLYSESLGDDLGLYKDPYSKFGQLTYEMWRAVRLVVDTGIHAQRWDRQKAIDFFKANAAKTELDITNETDRYIAWPGQALAYKIGELKIKELRARARERLGQRFDIREFHDAVLLSGSVPLDILERNVEAYVERKLAGSDAP